MTIVPFGRVVTLQSERSAVRNGFRIGLEAIEKSTGRLIHDPLVEYDGDGIAFRRGDVLFGKLRPNLRKAWLADRDGDAVGDFHVYRPVDALIDSRYLAYIVLSEPFLGPVIASVYGAKMPRADWQEVRSVNVWVPTLGEQRAIADYLDRETAQIDAFIAKNEELITLLTERRDTITFRLVTGLDSLETETKPVQADWFTRLPISWNVAPLYTMAQTVSGGTPKSDVEEYWTQGSGVDWLSIGDMQDVDAGNPHHGRRVTRAGLAAAGLTPQSGPLVLFAMYASVGEVAMLRSTAVWNQAILGIRANPQRLNHRYLYWALVAMRPMLGLYFRSNTQDNLNAAQVHGFRLPVPSLGEQLRIANHLDGVWAHADTAIETARRGIELARERRAALISAAVTGRIDVGVAA